MCCRRLPCKYYSDTHPSTVNFQTTGAHRQRVRLFYIHYICLFNYLISFNFFMFHFTFIFRRWLYPASTFVLHFTVLNGRRFPVFREAAEITWIPRDGRSCIVHSVQCPPRTNAHHFCTVIKIQASFTLSIFEEQMLRCGHKTQTDNVWLCVLQQFHNSISHIRTTTERAPWFSVNWEILVSTLIYTLSRNASGHRNQIRARFTMCSRPHTHIKGGEQNSDRQNPTKHAIRPQKLADFRGAGVFAKDDHFRQRVCLYTWYSVLRVHFCTLCPLINR